MDFATNSASLPKWQDYNSSVREHQAKGNRKATIGKTKKDTCGRRG